MNMKTPHKYQQAAVTQTLTALETDNTLLIAPTGGGKTFMAGMAVDEYISAGKKVLWLVNLESLLSQSYVEAEYFDSIRACLLHGTCRRDIEGNTLRNIIRSKDGAYINRPEELGNVMITSAISFNNFREAGLTLDFMPDLIVIDEAHKGTSSEFQKVKSTFPDARILGLTATPSRAQNKDDQERLTTWYSIVVEASSLKQLIELGQLVQPEYLSGYDINRDNVVDIWLDTVDEINRRTIVFCRDRTHAKKITKAFVDRGITAERLISEDPGEDSDTVNARLAKYGRFRRGETEVLVSCQALCEGFDEPLARYCFLLRNVGGEQAVGPENRALFQQMVGRVLRVYYPDKDQKPNALVVDFCTNLERFGPVEEWDWNLYDEDEQARVSHTSRIGVDGEIELMHWRSRNRVYHTCDACHHVYDIKKFSSCPARNCGHKHGHKITFTVKYLAGMLSRWNQKPNWRGWEVVPAGGNNIEKMKNIVRGAEVKMMKQEGLLMNKQYGVEIFKSPSELSDDFKWIEQICAKYRAGFHIQFMPERPIISKMPESERFEL